MWTKWRDWIVNGFKDVTPKGIAKKLGAAGAAGLVSYGALQLGEPPSQQQYLLDAQEGWLHRQVSGAQHWIERHPAITGTLAGCAAGSFVPVVGTIIGCATGATVGATIGSDERDARKEEQG